MEDETERETTKKVKKGLITIPSYEEVLQESSQSKPPQSLFTPSPSFSQAFSFIKNTEFYKSPPQINNASRQISETTTEGCSSSSNSAPLSSHSAPSRSSNANANANASANANAILVSHRQKGNPLLKHIRNVKWVFADIICDYLLGQSSCALYLSLRYHLLHPDYLYFRIRELQKNFKLRVVLCHVDVEDVIKPLHEVTRTAMLHDCSLVCGWSLEECGRYLETIKVYENKPADSLQGHTDRDYLSRLRQALTTVRQVNKTDVVTLGSTFGSLSHIIDASMEDLARCPGIGERKVKRLYDTFHEPFRRTVSSRSTNVSETNPKKITEQAVEKEAVDATEVKEDEPKLTVKSALTAAFAKYSTKVGKLKSPAKNRGSDK
ncbi:hypothetical protein GIB67_000923 [Kingdonia uniflora]|uniref:DNA excision repair protein ERCC-1 n=1 Tax=Kingdonia uniflora TaxID=39325 RepID=A0A7J7MFX3_9MAGN|nr:hypothetical protein GIB67_000923 [Kingdonia uniflora]